jgi:hypothetical protein
LSGLSIFLSFLVLGAFPPKPGPSPRSLSEEWCEPRYSDRHPAGDKESMIFRVPHWFGLLPSGTSGPGPRLSHSLMGLLYLFLSGCHAGGVSSGPLVLDTRAQGIAEDALRRSMPDSPVQITFDFRLREADLRFSGRGVARVQPPYRLRIDLFSPRGESLFRAALVGSELRVPLGVPLDLAPPPALLWAALGVFRPDAELRLLGGRGSGQGATTLHYGGDAAEELRFLLVDGGLSRAEILEGGHLIEEVDLEFDASRETVEETVYRNRALFVELTFTLRSVENVDAFPDEIWDPGH